MQWYFISLQAMEAIRLALTYNDSEFRQNALRKLTTDLHKTNAEPGAHKPEPRGLPSRTPYDPRRILRAEFITTMTIPGKRRPKKRMLIAVKLEDETIEFHLTTMGNHHAKQHARRWLN